MKKIPEFQRDFLEGSNHEVLACPSKIQLSKCEVPEPHIHYLAQCTTARFLWAMFSEYEAVLNGGYCLVVTRKGYPCYIPLTSNQVMNLELYNEDFNTAWMYSKTGRFRPAEAIFNSLSFTRDEIFYKGTKVCADLFVKNFGALSQVLPQTRKMFRLTREEAMQKVHDQFAKTSEKLRKIYQDPNLVLDFDLHLKLVNQWISHGSFRQLIEEDAFQTKFFKRPSPYLKYDEGFFYLIPNGKTTIAILFVSQATGYHFHFFSKYPLFYNLIKRLHEYFSSPDCGI